MVFHLLRLFGPGSRVEGFPLVLSLGFRAQWRSIWGPRSRCWAWSLRVQGLVLRVWDFGCDFRVGCSRFWAHG